MNSVGNPLGQQHSGQQHSGQQPLGHPGQQAIPQGPRTPWLPVGILAVVWAGIALGVGVLTVLYLGLGVVMTATVDGVFGGSGAAFNWSILLIALVGQLLGLVLSIVTLFGARAHSKQGRRQARGAVILGWIATVAFVIIGLIQIPLVPILQMAITA